MLVKYGYTVHTRSPTSVSILNLLLYCHSQRLLHVEDQNGDKSCIVSVRNFRGELLHETLVVEDKLAMTFLELHVTVNISVTSVKPL